MAHVSGPGIQVEAYVSVDVETSGPNPSEYDMLAIGACLVANPACGFYVELQPVTGNAIPGSLAISDLSLEDLRQNGLPPVQALQRFEAWLNTAVSAEQRPVFVALNAPFDWMFVNDYFHRFLKHNPFGHSALDIKAFYMGLAGTRWARTSMRFLAARYLEGRKLTHNALQDAQDQAEVFANILKEARARAAVQNTQASY
jgi:DNA polymerase III epsilon subunit-like protein